MSTHNMCFHREIKKKIIIKQISLLFGRKITSYLLFILTGLSKECRRKSNCSFSSNLIRVCAVSHSSGMANSADSDHIRHLTGL